MTITCNRRDSCRRSRRHRKRRHRTRRRRGRSEGPMGRMRPHLLAPRSRSVTDRDSTWSRCPFLRARPPPRRTYQRHHRTESRSLACPPPDQAACPAGSTNVLRLPHSRCRCLACSGRRPVLRRLPSSSTRRMALSHRHRTRRTRVHPMPREDVRKDAGWSSIEPCFGRCNRDASVSCPTIPRERGHSGTREGVLGTACYTIDPGRAG
jgi:hypothetical protein